MYVSLQSQIKDKMDLENLRMYCLSLKGVTEDVKWEHDLCFLIGEKMFCVTGFEPGSKVTFKVKDDEFDELCSRTGFMPAPYLARAKWVAVTDKDALSAKEWKYYIKQSYELIASGLTKKKRTELEIEG
jgi:predicted DNA-binding protein (MmcQ/YjbR family)